MDDTDRLIAAIFAATMTARLNVAKVEDFFTYYDACVDGIRKREAADGTGSTGRTLETFWSRGR